ncbi:MAG: hypothetical protein DYH18_04345 [Xanthomonadales bacterium PRO7]|jgi:hypothetical protein|nr:hypothetical protein [Xanthomonadales bacterium PRO7]HMM56479.1 hypothetical protein [Rudaea sp.]
MDEFTDIVIVDLDVNRTTWSRVHSSMRTLHLKLNRDPNPEWTRLFFEERNSRVELKRHGLWVEDGYIVFDCLLIDVDDYHLPDIRQSIDYANARSRVLVEARHAEVERLRDEAQSEAHMLGALRAAIRTPVAAPSPAPVAAPVTVVEPAKAVEPVTTVVAAEAVPAPELPMPPDAHVEPLHAEREAVLEARRNDWRARFRAALHRNK